MSNNITIDLKAKKDADGKIYYLAKIIAPVLIDCSEGAVFIIFTSEPGSEQMQIAPMTKKPKQDQEND